jgi:ATP-dependent DNA helicase DinG
MQIISDHQKQLIQANYSQWLESNGYQARRSQREMIAIIARMLAGVTLDAEGLRADESMQHVSLIEAGTGTGKTIAYALPAIAMALELDKKLVISTATINLQEQLVNVDLPNLQANTSLDFKYALAKGRQRYLCVNKLKLRLQDVSRAAGDLTLFPDEESSLADATVVQLEALDQHYLGGRWDGDQDSLEHEIGYEDWRLVAADRASCSGKKCVHYSNCALFKARDALRTADVVVANHDLVLADLAMGGANILPPPEQSIFVFDEAHHLPGKSRNHLSAHMSLASERSHVLQTKKVLARIAATKGAPSELKGLQKNLQTIDSGLQSSLENIGYTLQELLNND